MISSYIERFHLSLNFSSGFDNDTLLLYLHCGSFQSVVGKETGVIFWVADIYNVNVVGEKCVWLQNKERIGTHNNTVMML